MVEFRPIALVSLVGLCLCAGCSKEEPATVTPASGSGSSADAEASRPERPSAGIDPALLEQLPSLARVEQALSGAPVNIAITEAKRLEEARDWIAENYPDMSERDAELMAQMLVMIDDLMEADDLSLAKVKSIGESQLLQLWAMDADGDGALSDEEAASAMQRMMEMGEVMAEWNADDLDTNGDGEVSMEERMAMEQEMQANMQPLYDTMVERATLVSWDSNGDGFLSDAERAAGEETLDLVDWDGDGEFSEMERLAGYQSILQELSQGLVLVEQPDMSQFQAEMQQRIAAMNVPPPEQSAFDADGDGSYSDAEMAAYEAEMEVFRAQQRAMSQEMQQAGQDMMVRITRMQFEMAVAALDTDGDGLLMNEEWEGGYDNLRGQRDRRMFNYLYDADRSGSVTDAEVARFMDAYDNQSPYADADLNGTVDQADLQFFVTQVSGQ